MINKIGTYTALTSFLIGSLLLLIFYFSNSSDIPLLGYFFIIIAGLVNLGIFIVLMVKILTEINNRKKYIRTSAIMLLNIPVVVIYFYFVIVLMNTMRITFINETGNLITDLKIVGGEPKTIEKLDIGEKQTKWIEIKGDSSLSIEYKINGELRTELIYGYITSFSGAKVKYRIGKETKPIDETY
jgi:hypothetical protein